MAGGKRRLGQDDADLAACYGATALALDADAKFRLLLNVPRQRARQAMLIKEAHELASGKLAAPISHFQAIAETDAEAADLAYREAVAARESAHLG